MSNDNAARFEEVLKEIRGIIEEIQKHIEDAEENLRKNEKMPPSICK